MSEPRQKQQAEMWNRFVIIALIIIAVVNFYPVLQIISVSLQPMSNSLHSEFKLLPGSVTLANYAKVLFKSDKFPHYFLNSLLVGGTVMVIATTISALAAYSLARLKFRGRAVLDQLILFVYIIPPVMLIIPIYLLMVRLKMIDQQAGVILIHVLFVIPFGTWMLRGFFKSIPVELEDAARVDGTSRLGALFKIILPISAPGLATVAIFSLLTSWDEFMYSGILLNSEVKRTLPFGVYALVGTYGEVRWDEMMAASVLQALPMIIFFIWLQRYFVQGLSAGAVKG
jgi:multiple sugar transport system permease protein